MGVVTLSKGDRCICIGHFRDKRSESEKLSEKTQESFREELRAMFLRFPHLSRCEAPQYKWMETLLQGRKADATKRSVGFSDSLNGIENRGVIFKYDINSLKRRE